MLAFDLFSKTGLNTCAELSSLTNRVLVFCWTYVLSSLPMAHVIQKFFGTKDKKPRYTFSIRDSAFARLAISRQFYGS